VAAAVEVALIAPLRPHNLSRLNWGRHFHEPNGSKGRLLLRIPAQETKTKQRELVFELPDDVANRLRWYRRTILPRLGSDPNGDLFVTHGGALKDQKTLASQIITRIEQRVGLHMTPHQFRHVAASFYLRAHPEDFRTVTDLLGHSSAKTTLIYAGVSSERASRVYTNFVLEQREALKPKGRKSRATRVKRKGTRP
jgi:integrase